LLTNETLVTEVTVTTIAYGIWRADLSAGSSAIALFFEALEDLD
jgi:hypothetical protein